MASTRLLGRRLTQQFGGSPVDGQLGVGAPGMDRLVADAEELSDLGDLPPGCDEIEDLAAEL
ncbi:MAG: hypothetical protein H5T76_16560, partial [Streptomyces sp.]|nr:hypothetical protein [Streptomyces sp.]